MPYKPMGTSVPKSYNAIEKMLIIKTSLRFLLDPRESLRMNIESELSRHGRATSNRTVNPVGRAAPTLSIVLVTDRKWGPDSEVPGSPSPLHPFPVLC